MIVLIRKWIAWLALAVVVAGASIYWAADEWQWGEKIEAMQVLSWNVIDDEDETTKNDSTEDSTEDLAEALTAEADNDKENEEPEANKAEESSGDLSNQDSDEELTENVVGSINIDPSNNEVLNEQLTQTGVETKTDTWQNEAEELKWQRETQLAQEYDELKYLAETAQTETVRTQAQERMLEIKNAQSITQQAESMLKLKGYKAAVFVEGEQISAVVDQNIIQTDGIVIAEILERASGFAKENVLVIPR